MYKLLIFLALFLSFVVGDEDLVRMIKQGRFKRGAGLLNCDILNPACRRIVDQNNNRPRNREVTFDSGKCDYEDQTFWLIPGQADNSTCTRTQTFANGLKVRILNDTLKISPNPIRLPSCFDMSFQVEINEGIKDVRQSFIAKNEFQLYELPDIEKMQCQNASNDGCGGYGNNCIYCDVCESLKDVNGEPIHSTDKATNDFLNQFDDVKCPDKAGRYLVTRRLCFNDWSVMDRDGNCKLDMLESLTDDGNEQDAETLKEAFRSLQGNGHSTLISRFYLSHNSTATQLVRQHKKEAEIRADWLTKLKLRRIQQNWTVTDEEFASFVEWYIKFQRDTWHRDSYLPWLMYENELACLKVTFTVCDKEPVTVKTNGRSSAPSWFDRRLRPDTRCPT